VARLIFLFYPFFNRSNPLTNGKVYVFGLAVRNTLYSLQKKAGTEVPAAANIT
jgi:hypothetical protein